MLPAVVRVVCSERGRSERACAWGEHGVDYVGDRGQLIIIRLSDRKISRGRADGTTGSAGLEAESGTGERNHRWGDPAGTCVRRRVRG